MKGRQAVPAPIAEGNSDSFRFGTTTLHRLEHPIISDEFRQQHRCALAVPMEARNSAGRPYCWCLVASHVLHPKQLQSQYRWHFDRRPACSIGFVCMRPLISGGRGQSSGLRAELDIHTLDAGRRPPKMRHHDSPSLHKLQIFATASLARVRTGQFATQLVAFHKRLDLATPRTGYSSPPALSPHVAVVSLPLEH